MSEPSGAVLQLAGSLTLNGVEELRDRLVTTLAQNDAVQIDCTAAEEVDLSFIQLLVAARRSAESLGRKLCLSEPAAGPLLAALQRGGFVLADGVEGLDDPFWTKGTEANV